MGEIRVNFDQQDALSLVAECDMGDRFVPNPFNFRDANWEWDSCYIAMGLAPHDPNRARLELTNLMNSQHGNGMVPHMVFRGDMPEAVLKGKRMWGTGGPTAPEDLQTTGITQPPVIATATRAVAEHLPGPDRTEFLSSMFGKLVAYHEWFLRERDPDGDGVVTIVSPWESGMDNSPSMLAGITPTADEERLGELNNHLRNDVQAGLDSSLRTPPGTHVAVEGLMHHLKSRNYDWQDIITNNPRYAIDSVLVNNILLDSTKSLKLIAAELGEALTPVLTDYLDREQEIMGAFWDKEDKRFYDRFTATKQPIRIPAISNVFPIVNPSALTSEQAGSVITLLKDERAFAAPYGASTISQESDLFHPLAYWRGPMWPWINRYLFYGAQGAGESALASNLRTAVIDVVSTHGAYEHYSPITSEPGGARSFSPTAATFLELSAVQAA